MPNYDKFAESTSKALTGETPEERKKRIAARDEKLKKEKEEKQKKTAAEAAKPHSASPSLRKKVMDFLHNAREGFTNAKPLSETVTEKLKKRRDDK